MPRTEQESATYSPDPYEIAQRKTIELVTHSLIDPPSYNEYQKNEKYRQESLQNGEGFLMSADTNVLHLAIVEGVPQQHRKLINCALNFTREIHQNMREDGYTPEINHIYRTALRGIMSNPNIPIEQVLLRLFHDTEEDYPQLMNKARFKEYFSQRLGVDEDRDRMLDHVYIGIHGMNKNRTEIGPPNMDKAERENRYLDQIKLLAQQYPDLGIQAAKFDDTIDSFYGDVAKLLSLLAGYRQSADQASNFDEADTDYESENTIKLSDLLPPKKKTPKTEETIKGKIQRIQKSSKKVRQRMRIFQEETVLNQMEAAILVGEQLTKVEHKKGEIIIVDFSSHDKEDTTLREIA